jgi:hypothetical protein
MVIEINSELEHALSRIAKLTGTSPETLAIQILRERFVDGNPSKNDGDQWEQFLRAAASDCGTSLSHSALSSEELYD